MHRLHIKPLKREAEDWEESEEEADEEDDEFTLY